MDFNLWIWYAGLIFTCLIHVVSSIGCFKCTSINNSEPDCEDTFNNTGKFYEPICYTGRADRVGLFPGTDCIKMKAEIDGHTIVVRDCTVDSGGINSETEIGRESHCGFVDWLNFNGVMMRGCSLACRNADGCNGSATISLHIWTLLLQLCIYTKITHYFHQD